MRVWREDQDEARQVDGLDAICDERHVERVSEAAAKRPVFDTVLGKLSAGDSLVIWDLDRAFRSVVDMLLCLEDLDKRGVKFQIDNLGVDTATESGELVTTMMAAVARFERRLIARRTKERHEGAAAARKACRAAQGALRWPGGESRDGVLIMSGASDLEKFARDEEHRLIHKPPAYFDVYDLHCAKYRNTAAKILEIGVYHGGSLQMWKNYLGKDCAVWGADINQKTKKFEEPQIKIRIGDQEDRSFLRSLMAEIGEVDIIVDDGGHKMNQQINTFEETFPFLKPGGTYICEDVGTSYRQSHGGGYAKSGTFVEYCKDMVDKINIGDWPLLKNEDENMLSHLRWLAAEGPAARMDAKDTIRSVSFYTSMVVIEKWLERRSGVGEFFGTPSY